MRRAILIIAACAALSGCAVARVAGNVAVGTGQVALGAADMVI